MAGEKTEKATPKRRQDERKKGNVFMSREAVTLATLVATFYALKAMSPMIFENLQALVLRFFQLSGSLDHLNIKVLQQVSFDLIVQFAVAVLPILGATVLAAVVATMLQTKMLVSMESIRFKANRLNPLSGFQKMFSMRSVVELLKASLKIIVLGAVIYQIIKNQIFSLPRLMDLTPHIILMRVGEMVSDIVMLVAILFIALVAGDYFYQWWEYEKNLRMTKQEIKDEYKQMEGDPKVKGRQRSIQQQRARNRMMQAVPSADVVIRNPTHYAVALRYHREQDPAPLVVAKGQDALALKIVAIAEKNDVYVMEDKPLARGLYAAIEVGQAIPAEFYEPVAQVLAFVYNLKKKDPKL